MSEFASQGHLVLLNDRLKASEQVRAADFDPADVNRLTVGAEADTATVVIERLGGDVGVISQPGQGSTFSFTLPTG